MTAAVRRYLAGGARIGSWQASTLSARPPPLTGPRRRRTRRPRAAVSNFPQALPARRVPRERPLLGRGGTGRLPTDSRPQSPPSPSRLISVVLRTPRRLRLAGKLVQIPVFTQSFVGGVAELARPGPVAVVDVGDQLGGLPAGVAGVFAGNGVGKTVRCRSVRGLATGRGSAGPGPVVSRCRLRPRTRSAPGTPGRGPCGRARPEALPALSPGRRYGWPS